MNTCTKCGKVYESTSLCWGDVDFPSGRLVVEIGKDKISRTLDLCPDCTEEVMEWMWCKPEEENDEN